MELATRFLPSGLPVTIKWYGWELMDVGVYCRSSISCSIKSAGIFLLGLYFFVAYR
ncbi:hypothetical protein CIN_12860 [Commensalibacter intestini A911]|uniref:Uncharacterized protein n=1 Tax=Commensalibacter intestini A911 TaxID=1088868 RepID=G6F1D3_9PROT|nr:hypothetical protein CIN_12860 [Commensalibacter intestini A911]